MSEEKRDCPVPMNKPGKCLKDGCPHWCESQLFDYVGCFFKCDLKPFQQKKILLATGIPHEMKFGEQDYINYITKFLKDVNRVNTYTYIKMHPRERANYYDKIIKELGYENTVEVVKPNKDKKLLYELIRKCNVIFSFGSTVSIEAMVMRVPSFYITNCYNLPIHPDQVLSITDDVGEVVKKY